MATNDFEDDWELVSKPTPQEHHQHKCIHRKWGIFEFHMHICQKTEINQGLSSITNKPGVPSASTPSTTIDETHLQSQSPLFDLPAELRLRIYEALLTAPDGVQAGYKHTSTRPSILSILQTCRRILFEAEEIYYSINRLEHRAGSRFPRCLSSRRREAITALTVSDNRGMAGATAHLAIGELVDVVPNLESLWISSRMSIRFFDVHSWKLMERQIGRELSRFKCLKEFKVVLQEVKGELSEAEALRKEKLEGVVGRLQRGVLVVEKD